MELKKTKKPIMGLAALLIILFHLFPVIRGGLLSNILSFIVKTAYIGVDIFFFMSGYMAYFSKTDNYSAYIKRKIFNIYPVFIFSCILYVLMGGLSPNGVLLTLSGAELFMKGGASFLWFVPAIMIFYLFVPLYKKLPDKNIKIILTLILWIVLMIFMEHIFDNHSVNIFLCRLPIILIGFALAKYEGRLKKSYELILSLFLLFIGTFLTWKFCYMLKAEFLVSDIFYVIAIPYVLGIILLADFVFSRIRVYIFEFLGGMSLELYCFQMLFGAVFFKLASVYLKNVMVLFLAVLIAIMFISLIISRIKIFIFKR